MRLYDLEQSLIEDLNNNLEEIKQSEYPSEYLSETVDSLIPVHTSDLLELAQDNPCLAVDKPDLYGFDGTHSPINGIVGNVCEYLCEKAHEWAEENEIKL